MVFDAHIHVRDGEVDKAGFAERLRAAGVTGGIVISKPPRSFGHLASSAGTTARLDNVFEWCKSAANLHPAYWIDPLDRDATRQVAQACERGIAAFKIICSRHRVGDPRCFKVYRAIARSGRPLLFHSGILWDGQPSSMYNRPAEFEALLRVDGLRFSLAHISWPWCDECLSVYGKFLNAYTRRPDLSVEMFIDTTPGTPPIYRRDALTKLYTVGYDLENNVFFGADCTTGAGYNADWTREWVSRDRRILRNLGVSKAATDKMLAGNALRFLGLSKERVSKRPLRPAN